MYRLEKPSEELAFAYYIMFISSHVYSMRQRNVLKVQNLAHHDYYQNRHQLRYALIVRSFRMADCHKKEH